VSPPIPEPGQTVIVRRRPFVVNDIQTSTLPLPANVQDQSTRQHLLRLSSIEDEGLGDELSVIWELEPGVMALVERNGFQPRRLHDRTGRGWLQRVSDSGNAATGG